MLFRLLILLFYGCSATPKPENIILFKYFNNNKEYNLESIKSHLKLLDENNNDITSDKEYGIKKNDSTTYLSFKGNKENLIRKIVKDNDTMLLYFKRGYKESNTPNLIYTIDSLMFKKGKYLLDDYHYYNPLIFDLLWPKYYNEYINLTLNEKEINPDYKSSIVYKELSNMRNKLLKTKYDYFKINHLDSYENVKFQTQKEYTYSRPFTINKIKYIWEFSYKKPKKTPWKGWIELIDHNLVDLGKEEIILRITDNIHSQTTLNIEDLKNGNKRYCKFMDANFDGKTDFIQGPYYELTTYLYNDKKKSFDYFEELAPGRLKVDSIHKKLISTKKIGRFDGHINEKTIVYFNKDGNLDFIEEITKEAIKINAEFYHVITKRKKIKKQRLETIDKEIDTVKVKPDYWAYKFYKQHLKTKN